MFCLRLTVIFVASCADGRRPSVNIRIILRSDVLCLAVDDQLGNSLGKVRQELYSCKTEVIIYKGGSAVFTRDLREITQENLP